MTNTVKYRVRHVCIRRVQREPGSSIIEVYHDGRSFRLIEGNCAELRKITHSEKPSAKILVELFQRRRTSRIRFARIDHQLF